MSKADDTAKKTAMVKARLGATTGASQGYQPPPKAKIKARPMGGLKPHGVKITGTIKW